MCLVCFGVVSYRAVSRSLVRLFGKLASGGFWTTAEGLQLGLSHVMVHNQDCLLQALSEAQTGMTPPESLGMWCWWQDQGQMAL